MDHKLRLQLVGSGQFSVSGRASAEPAAFVQQLRARRPMNCAVYAAPAQQSFVRRVDDRIHIEGRDVAFEDLSLIHIRR